ncbi:MAG TPA: hypothetical protein VIT44_13815 [Cyclobacteriaceae bacterium]
MPVKDFFRLIIKLFGLYCLVTSLFTVLPYSSNFVLQGIGPEFWILAIAVFILLILLFMLLIYSTDRIVDKLDLTHGFTNPNIDFGSLNDQMIIKLGCILIGGFLLIDNLGPFLADTYLLFRQDEVDEPVRKNYLHMGTKALNLLIGYLLITNYDRVSRFFALKKEEN